MEEYIGLDVSMKETAVSIRREGKRIWRGKCASDPKLIAELIRKRAPSAKRVVFETGPLSVWFYHALRAEGLPAICIDARHAKAALDMAANKTDANDADGLAHLAEVGFFREVRVKGFDSMLTRTLVAARTRLVRITTELSNQIRGLMKTFGLLVPAGKGSTFEKNVRSLLVDQEGLAPIVLPMLEAWRSLRTRRYQSGEVDYDGHISRRGDRVSARSETERDAQSIRPLRRGSCRSWGLKLRERVGFKRAAVAVARKLAVTMHAMLKTGTFCGRRTLLSQLCIPSSGMARPTPQAAVGRAAGQDDRRRFVEKPSQMRPGRDA